jgi:ketosteroid isomerase-like protein
LRTRSALGRSPSGGLKILEHPNVALLSHLYEAFDKNDVATLSKLIADDAVWHVPGSTPISGEHRGQTAIFAFFQRLAEMSGGTFRAQLVDVMASDMHAVALATVSGTRGERTYDSSYLLLFRIEKDRIVEARLFNDDQDAFNAFWS